VHIVALIVALVALAYQAGWRIRFRRARTATA
jgi:hypothetical protein